eukprot:CAMPEP_0202916162 /NCGR_PEP_ID=MMETSP1392-20130828/67799_1 /ASSEMBLY_ACC=CAM_ASM_000868 /TAXON_ID=225041 /ORGANISM="Chlamydomonas chlamydogama, Strain SAG 11-48b" /LENGTH=41 /DNA_ID= /DNA_START= /DNA_END= /DNA_ORIENTATION=
MTARVEPAVAARALDCISCIPGERLAAAATEEPNAMLADVA